MGAHGRAQAVPQPHYASAAFAGEAVVKAQQGYDSLHVLSQPLQRQRAAALAKLAVQNYAVALLHCRAPFHFPEDSKPRRKIQRSSAPAVSEL